MIPYNQLTNLGKLHRLRKLAETGLSQYDLRCPQVTYHGFHTNLMYRVMAETGEKFMLRLAHPGWRTYEDLISEALWLKALREDTELSVPCIVPTRSGEDVLAVDFPGIPKTWYMTLMCWVPGRLLGNYLTEPNLEKMGILFADLHRHGTAWVPPAAFTKHRFEHWLSRDEENLITGAENTSGKRLSIPLRDVLARMNHLVESAYAKLDRADLRVIHCDLWHDNIKLHKGILHPIDFEDTVWGFRAHDMAMAMLDLLETVGEERCDSLFRAFRRGYESKMDWPDAPMEPFQIGRLLWKINWMARFEPQHLEKMIQAYVPVFEHYEKTRKVVLPG